MDKCTDQQDLQFEAVVNKKEQYAIWPADTALRAGWRKAAKRGTKDEWAELNAMLAVLIPAEESQ